MSPIAKLGSFAHPPWPLLFSISVVGLMLATWTSAVAILPTYCGSSPVQQLFEMGWMDLTLFLALNPPSLLAASWLLMLVAMMPPLLAMPLNHVWRASLSRYRGHAVFSFLLGYSVVWMLAGPVLVGLALVLRFASGSGAFGWAIAAAILWSATPWQRVALNQSHRFRRIGIFGLAKYRDNLSFGAAHGCWCIASCWAWMIVPLSAGSWHIGAMGVTGLIMVRERLSASARPAWRLPVMVTALADLLRVSRTDAARG